METILDSVVWPRPGKYVVAVSGGVDSMSLLYMLFEHGGYELEVAHCNHGIRLDSYTDEQLVHEMAAEYGLPFQNVRLQLGGDASEDDARRARYDFLYSVLEDASADAIITAHHLDDRAETMLLNKQRGAGWMGLSPLHETETIKRPLLNVNKEAIYRYAKEHNLKWREDRSNLDPEYTPRNKIRQQLNTADKGQLYQQLRQYDEQRKTREQYTESILERTTTYSQGEVSVDRLQLLEHDVPTVRDILYILLRRYFRDYMEVDFDAVLRLEHFYKTASKGKKLSLSDKVWARMDSNDMVVFVTKS